MKTIFTLFVACISCWFTFGQITLTDVDFPNADESFTMSQASDLQVDYATTGPNHQWDFSHLSYASQAVRDHSSLSGAPFLITFTYGPLAISAYRATYRAPFTDLPLDQLGGFLPIQIADVFQYTKKTPQKLNLIGYSASISGQDVPIKSDTVEAKYIFPLEYGDEYISKGYTDLDMSAFINAQWVQSRKRTSVVDGWGTITTPFGTFDVLRIQHQIEEIDTITYEGTSFGTPLPVTYEYEWLAAGEKVPVLKIVTSEVGGNETVISVEYKDNNYSGIENATANGLMIYPNPVSDELMISWKNGLKNVNIYQLDGTLINTFSFEGIEYGVNTSDLNVGMYFISVESEGEVVTSSFVKR